MSVTGYTGPATSALNIKVVFWNSETEMSLYLPTSDTFGVKLLLFLMFWWKQLIAHKGDSKADKTTKGSGRWKKLRREKTGPRQHSNFSGKLNFATDRKISFREVLCEKTLHSNGRHFAERNSVPIIISAVCQHSRKRAILLQHSRNIYFGLGAINTL